MVDPIRQHQTNRIAKSIEDSINTNYDDGRRVQVKNARLDHVSQVLTFEVVYPPIDYITTDLTIDPPIKAG